MKNNDRVVEVKTNLLLQMNKQCENPYILTALKCLTIKRTNIRNDLSIKTSKETGVSILV